MLNAVTTRTTIKEFQCATLLTLFEISIAENNDFQFFTKTIFLQLNQSLYTSKDYTIQSIILWYRNFLL